MLQTLYAMPYLVSPIVIGYLWTLLLSPTFGPVNQLLTQIGLDSWALPWLGDPKTALWVVILVSVWQWIGFPVLLYGAALGGVPEELTEAARVDGASHRQAFFKITLPLLVPAIGTVSVLTFIFAMEAFALPYAFGGSTGNPAGRNGLRLAALLPHGLRLRGDRRHRQLVGPGDAALPHHLRRRLRRHGRAAPTRAEDHRMTTAVATTEVPQELAAARPAQGSRRRPPRANRPVGGPGASLLLWGYAALALVPLLLMVSNSFRSNADLITDPLGLPAPPTTASYVEAWTTGNFATYFGNSLARHGRRGRDLDGGRDDGGLRPGPRPLARSSAGSRRSSSRASCCRSTWRSCRSSTSSTASGSSTRGSASC